MQAYSTEEDSSAAVRREGEENIHLFRDLVNSTKSVTVSLYSKVNLRSAILEENFQKLNSKTEPMLEKVTSVLDLGLNKVIGKVTPITKKVGEVKNSIVTKTADSKKKVGELINKAAEKGKENQIFKRAEKLSNDILTHLERDVNDLEGRVNTFFKTSKRVDEDEKMESAGPTDSLVSESSLKESSVERKQPLAGEEEKGAENSKISFRVKRLSR